MRAFLLILALSFLMIFGATSPKAKHGVDQCKGAENTADILACTVQNHGQAQEQLNDIYQKVLALQTKETHEHFLSAQKDWILYRDGECNWKADQAKTESLRRIEELHCVTDLTKQRTQTLTKSFEDVQKTDEPDSSLPRWMNVVASEHPDIFWRYGDSLSVDLDCDGDSEEIMVGQKISVNDVRLEHAPAHTINAVISVTQNPMTGRPKTKLFSLADMRVDQEACDLNVKMSMLDHPTLDDKEGADVCTNFIEIKDSKCAPLALFWDGADYKISAVPTD